MTDAIQTIRTFLLKMISIGVYGSRIALTALDSLAVKPSENAIGLAQKIEGRFHQGHYADDYNAIAALIQARDERILRERLEKINHVIEIRGHDSLGWPMITDDEIKSILTPEATNGQ